MRWRDLLKIPTPEPVVEVRPGTNVFSGCKLVLKVRVWRASEQRWIDVPEEVSTIEGAK